MRKKIKHVAPDDFKFEVNNFHGPLDLLLHLAKTNEIEISDVSLDLLIDQYINYIEQVEAQGIEVSSIYLEMAAELIRIKSQMLIPNTSDDELYLDQLDELGLDREQLINKLLEYKQYKEASQEMDELSEIRHSLFTRPSDKMLEYRHESFKKSIKLDDFIKATKSFIYQELESSKETRTVDFQEIPIEQYIEQLKHISDDLDVFAMMQKYDMHNRISFFMAILESLKLQYISFYLLDEVLFICRYQEEAYD